MLVHWDYESLLIQYEIVHHQYIKSNTIQGELVMYNQVFHRVIMVLFEA
jgi:hypothetical protein